MIDDVVKTLYNPAQTGNLRATATDRHMIRLSGCATAALGQRFGGCRLILALDCSIDGGQGDAGFFRGSVWRHTFSNQSKGAACVRALLAAHTPNFSSLAIASLIVSP